MKKRLISILVAMALLLGTVPVSVFAEEEENNTDTDVQVVDTEEEVPEAEETEETEAVEPEADGEPEETEPSEEIAEAVVPVYEDPADPDQDETEMIPVDLDTVVTADNFFEFFNDYGELLETAGDELTFKGDFSGLDLDNIVIGRPVAITSDNAVFKNVSFYVVSGEVSIDGIKIIDNDKKNSPAAVYIEGGEDIKISDCTVEFAKEDGNDGSCIHACNSDKLSISDCTIRYTGDTDSSNFNRPIWIDGGSDITIKDNTIEASIPSADVNYTEDFAMVYMSVGISLNDCKGVDLINNNATVTSAGKSGYYPTACAVSITSTGLTVKDNTISITGSDYVYGFDAASDLLDCSGNTVNVTSDHYGSAFQLTGPATSEIISSNKVSVEAASEGHGIYVGEDINAGEPYSVTISSNEIELSSEKCTCIYYYAWSEGKHNCFTVKDNKLKAEGSKLYGVSLLYTTADSVISGNEINTPGSDTASCGIITDLASVTGNQITSTGLGISVQGASMIEGNHVETTHEYTVDANNTKSTVTDNHLKAAALTGDDSVTNKDNADVHDNYPPVSIAKAIVTGISGKTYTGKAITQKPVVKLGGVTLKSGTDYKLSYKNNTNAGKATVTITGTGDYTGSVKKTFKIDKAKNPLKVSKKSSTIKVKYSKLKKANQAFTNTKLFKISKKGQGKLKYSLSSVKKSGESFKSKFTLSSAGKLKVKKGLAKGSYKVKVKVNAAGNSNYKSATTTVTFTVKVL